MMKNRQVRLLAGILIGIDLFSIIYCLLFYPRVIKLVLFLACSTTFITFIFTYERYLQIQKLSTYLQTIYQNQEILDIRDNEEGELSILKNDIYKMTYTLKHQAQLLKKDKLYLAQALSNISHQLKTPITSMFLMNDLLKQENLDQKQKEIFLRTNSNQLHRIEWLVSSLLKLSKIDAEAVTFKKDTIVIETLLNEALQPLEILCELKNINILKEGDLNAVIIGDFSWLTEAFSNVLKNCVEHTLENKKIYIKVVSNPLHTSIVIQDEGTGIDQEDIPHLFERFYKGKNAKEDSVGIGLAMAKTIIQQNQGEITVTSVKDKGSCFTIRFFHTVV